MAYILETKDLTYAYTTRQEEPSLSSVSVGISEGARTAILGANGAGKSTLFYHFNGILKPKSGEVLYRGKPLEYTKEALSVLRNDISVVVQNPDEQIFSATVEEDVAFGPMNMGMERDEIERRIQSSLFKVGMEDYRYRPTIQLSYGQRKRVALAGALAIDPKVLILDEPTAGLDPQMSQEVIELVEELISAGTTVIISTHDVDLAYSWADEIHVLRRGKLVYSGKPEPFFEDRVQTAMSGLVLPHTFSVNHSVQAIRGKPEAPFPRTNSQMLCKMLPENASVGKIRLIAVSDSLPEPAGTGRVGIYGSNVRRLFRAADMAPDFHFNAVEYCLMEAISGRDSVLYCDECVKGAVLGRIDSMKEFGKSVEVVM